MLAAGCFLTRGVTKYGSTGILYAYGTRSAPDGRARAEFQIHTIGTSHERRRRGEENQIYTVVTRVGRGVLYNQIYLDASMCEMRSRHLDE